MKMKFENSKLSGRRLAAIAVIIIIIIIAVLTTAIMIFRTVTDKTVDQITETISIQYSQELNAQMSSQVSSTLNNYYNDLTTAFESLRLSGVLTQEDLLKYISKISEGNDISYLAFLDDEGYIYEDDGSYLGTMRFPDIAKLLNGRKKIIIDNVTIGEESYIMLGCSFEETIQMGNRTICAALLGINNFDAEIHVDLYSDYSGGYSSIINTDGSYVVKNSSEPFDGLNVFSILKKYYKITEEELTEIKEAVKKNQSYIFYAVKKNGGRAVYMYFSPASGSDWYIANTLPATFIKRSIVGLRDSLEKLYFGFMIFLFIIAALIVIQQALSAKRLRKSKKDTENALAFAERASRAKTDFLFSMSHDIRTPMNAILGFTDIGLKNVENPEVSADSYKKIRMAGGHLLDLINDILEMSRIESGKIIIEESPVDIRLAFDEIMVMSRSLADEKNIDFVTNLENIRNPYVYADSMHINQVIINIVSNAVKYTPEGGRVTYTVSQLDGTADGKVLYRFEISDTGIGMSQDFLEHIFEEFSREKDLTTAKIEGTGLGLSIVKKIVDLAGGTIRVDSVKGEGSTFTVDLPFAVMDEEAVQKFISEKESASELSSDINFEGMKVLLAEDNELNQEIAASILEDEGIEVDTADDGSLALKAVMEKGSDYYDFILMDIQMPVMDGFEATREIRKLPGGDKIPIIALSANAFEEDRKKSIESGMNAHVAKPIDIRLLLETMQSLSR